MIFIAYLSLEDKVLTDTRIYRLFDKYNRQVLQSDFTNCLKV